jgi:hypothetical protein
MGAMFEGASGLLGGTGPSNVRRFGNQLSVLRVFPAADQNPGERLMANPRKSGFAFPSFQLNANSTSVGDK